MDSLSSVEQGTAVFDPVTIAEGQLHESPKPKINVEWFNIYRDQTNPLLSRKDTLKTPKLDEFARFAVLKFYDKEEGDFIPTPLQPEELSAFTNAYIAAMKERLNPAYTRSAIDVPLRDVGELLYSKISTSDKPIPILTQLKDSIPTLLEQLVSEDRYHRMDRQEKIRHKKILEKMANNIVGK